MRVVLFLLILILILLVAYFLAKPCKEPILLTPEARTDLINYFVSFPPAWEHETHSSGVKFIGDRAEKFFAVELTESEHADIAQMVQANKGIVTPSIVQAWIKENRAEFV